METEYVSCKENTYAIANNPICRIFISSRFYHKKFLLGDGIPVNPLGCFINAHKTSALILQRQNEPRSFSFGASLSLPKVFTHPVKFPLITEKPIPGFWNLYNRVNNLFLNKLVLLIPSCASRLLHILDLPLTNVVHSDQ